MLMVVGSSLILAPSVFVMVPACTFQFVGQFFFPFVKTFPTFALGVGFRA